MHTVIVFTEGHTVIVDVLPKQTIPPTVLGTNDSTNSRKAWTKGYSTSHVLARTAFLSPSGRFTSGTCRDYPEFCARLPSVLCEITQCSVRPRPSTPGDLRSPASIWAEIRISVIITARHLHLSFNARRVVEEFHVCADAHQRAKWRHNCADKRLR